VRIIFAGMSAPPSIRGARSLEHIPDRPRSLLTPDADPL
jgi:hypothetical protein